MSKSKFHTVYGTRVYSIDYLMNEELTESDLSHLLDTKSLIYSLIIAEFREIDSKKQNRDIIKSCKKDNKWLYNNRWSEAQFNSFEEKVVKAFKNLYCIDDNHAISKAQWFMIQYGLSVIGSKVTF